MRSTITRFAAAALLAAGFVGAAGTTRAAAPATVPCVQAAQPAWIDYGDKWVPFRHMFFRPGLAVALAHDAAGSEARRRGTQLAFWTMSLARSVGTPRAPAAAQSIRAAAARVFESAVRVTGCSTPVVALNELFGAHRRTPWSPRTARYRENVLSLVRELAARGAEPHLLISQEASTRGAAGAWWRDVASAATIVREVYLPAPQLHGLGAGRASVYIRFQLRRAVRNLTTIGVPSSRVALMLGFHHGRGGRMGLAAPAWFGVVKRETLAAKQVARELGVGSVWSWGWATFPGRRADSASRRAACVYLWARDQSLCDGPAAAGKEFDRSLAQPAEGAPRVGMRLLSGRHPAWFEVRAAARLTGRISLLQVREGDRWRGISRLVLGPFHARRIRAQLPDGRHLVRLFVAAENAPGGGALSTRPLAVRVH